MKLSSQLFPTTAFSFLSSPSMTCHFCIPKCQELMENLPLAKDTAVSGDATLPTTSGVSAGARPAFLPAPERPHHRAYLAGRPRSRVLAVFSCVSGLPREDFCPTFILGECYPPGHSLCAPLLHLEHRPALPLSLGARPIT